MNSTITISEKALQNNILQIKKTLSKKTALMCVIKANAYGHGLNEITSLLVKNKHVDWFAVFSFQDALYVRKHTQKKILVLANVEKEYWYCAIKNAISITISQKETLIALKEFSKKQKLCFHLKVDTGLGRQGFLLKEQELVTDFLKTYALVPEGLYSHLSAVEESKFDEYTSHQYEELLVWKNSLSYIGVFPLVHLASTAGALRFRALHLDVVRVGIGLYGLYPSAEVKKQFEHKVKLAPVLSWKTYVHELKTLSRGSYIGYDCTYKTTKETKIAILPIGYFDGYSRSLSNKGYVLIQGKICPILGRIMMNMCVVDVTHLKKVCLFDEVVLIGAQKKQKITVEELAMVSDTINYELVTKLPLHITRTKTCLQKTKK